MKKNLDWLVRAFAASSTALLLNAAHAVGPSVLVDGPAAPVLQGDSFLVTMSGTGFVPIVGGGANLTFAADMLELLSVHFDARWNFFADAGAIDNVGGKATDMSFNTFPGFYDGDFPIATLEFRAKAPGLATIDLSSSDMFPFGDLDGAPVAVGFSGASVQISSPVPETSAWLLLACGMGVVLLSARTRDGRSTA